MAFELLWAFERWPMNVSVTDGQHLAGRARQYESSRAEVESILDGYRPPLDALTPAVPFRDYQLTAAGLACATGHLLLGDDVGVGKTHSAMAVMCSRGHSLHWSSR